MNKDEKKIVNLFQFTCYAEFIFDSAINGVSRDN